jgi:hypothetical protein
LFIILNNLLKLKLLLLVDSMFLEVKLNMFLEDSMLLESKLFLEVSIQLDKLNMSQVDKLNMQLVDMCPLEPPLPTPPVAMFPPNKPHTFRALMFLLERVLPTLQLALLPHLLETMCQVDQVPDKVKPLPTLPPPTTCKVELT